VIDVGRKKLAMLLQNIELRTIDETQTDMIFKIAEADVYPIGTIVTNFFNSVSVIFNQNKEVPSAELLKNALKK
jgi:hypothetical protein